MNATEVIYLCTKALELVVTLSAPAVLAALAVGLLLSVLQAATQIQEQAISVVAKIATVFVVLALTATWMLNLSSSFVIGLLDRLGGIGS